MKNYIVPENVTVVNAPDYDYSIECPFCNEESNVSEWDTAAYNYYDDNGDRVVSLNHGHGLEDVNYVCPKCNEEVAGTDFIE